VAAAVKMEAAK